MLKDERDIEMEILVGFGVRDNFMKAIKKGMMDE